VELFNHDNDAINDNVITTAADPDTTKPFDHTNDDDDAAVTNASNVIDTNTEQLPSDDNTQASFPHLQEPVVFTIEPFNCNNDAVDNDTVKQLSNQQEDVIAAHDITQSQPLDHHLPLVDAIEPFDYKKCLNELNKECKRMEQLWLKLAIDETTSRMEQPTPAPPQNLPCTQQTTIHSQSLDDNFPLVGDGVSFDYKLRLMELDEELQQMAKRWPILAIDEHSQTDQITPSTPPQNPPRNTKTITHLPHPASLENRMHTNITPTTAEATTMANTRNESAQKSISALVNNTLYCAPQNISASSPALVNLARGRYWQTPLPTHTNITLDNPVPTTTTTIPRSELVFADAGDGNKVIHTPRTSKPAGSDSANDAKTWTASATLEKNASDLTGTDYLTTAITRLHDSIARLADQSAKYSEMLVRTNAQILEDLQQLVQLFPQFLATISQYIPAPVPTQLMTSYHPQKVNTYIGPQKPSWPPPKHYIRPIPALLTPHLKPVRFKTHAPCSCLNLMSWPNDMRPP